MAGKRFASACVFIAVAAVMLHGVCAWGLTADQIALIVNKNEPQSQRLAERYVMLRHLPAGRIISLDLPTAEQMTFDEYERGVVPPVAAFLREHQLEQTITCLVTFYGVPLRIAPKLDSADDRKEANDLMAESQQLTGEADAAVKQLEALAKSVDPSYVPVNAAVAMPQLIARADRAIAIVAREVDSTLGDAKTRESLQAQLIDQLRKLGGTAAIVERMARPTAGSINATPEARQSARDIIERFELVRKNMAPLQEERADPLSRTKLREMVQQNFGVLAYQNLLQGQIEYLQSGKTSGAALDNELACLWWGFYPRNQWQMNPLNFHARPGAPRTMMVMRLDAPTPERVAKMIDTSLLVEDKGLTGQIVVDARGIIPNATNRGYADFDAKLDALAGILRSSVKLPLMYDAHEPVLPPGSAKNVALYCGWYSLRNYVSSCEFAPGAVGYHVASYELASLHNPNERGWVAGLLRNGCVASLGPVDEPYLVAFPAPDEFFPLLLTGKLTLAEVYWKTEPTVSWMISMIGDPLYNPYKLLPALSPEKLPAQLRPALGESQ